MRRNLVIVPGAVLMLAVTACTSTPNNPAAVGEAFINHVLAGEAEDACSLGATDGTPVEADEMDDCVSFLEMAASVADGDRDARVAVETATVNGAEAHIDTEDLSESSRDTWSQLGGGGLDLVKIEGQWYIDMD